MRVVFMGTPEYAVPTLKKLSESKHTLVGVFTQPDKARGRGNRISFSPVKELAVSLGIPVYQPQRIRIDGVNDLISLNPDVCVTAAFGQILSQQILDIPALGTVNVHASLLPKYRGSSPIPWCLMAGENLTGVTTMFTDAGIDTGDILLKKECPIDPEDNTETLTHKLAVLGADLLMETLDCIENQTCVRTPQDESLMSYFPKITKEMGKLDFSQDAIKLHNKVRALNPWPGCFIMLNGEMVKIWETVILSNENITVPGLIISPDKLGGISIATGTDLLHLKLMQAPGGKKMSSQDYLRGHKITVQYVDK